MDGFLLFKEVNCSCGNYQVLRISSHVDFCNLTGYDPSMFYGETDMNQNTSKRNTVLPLSWIEQFS